MKKIVLTGGGTSGHVTPNFALIPYLQKDKWEINYIGSYKGMERQLVEKEGIPYYPINSGKLRRYFDVKNLSDVFKVIAGVAQAVAVLKKIKPDVVFSKGGFVSCPVVWAAWLCRIPAIVHESDYTPGLTNKLTIPFAKKICYTFKETEKYLPSEKAVYTGLPIRNELIKGNARIGRKFCSFDDEKPILFATGGSQGAETINKLIRENIDVLLKDFNICHQCGKGNLDVSLSNINGYQQFEYINKELPDVYAMSHIVISRAGATTIFELLELKKPSILIPLSKKVSRGDQILNAESFLKNGFCEVIQEEDLKSENFISIVKKLQKSYQEYIRNIDNIYQSGAAERVVNVIKQAFQPF